MTNDCQWVESKLEDYLVGSPDAEIRSRIASHLETCDTCRQEVEAYGKVDTLVRAHFGRQMARAESGARLGFRPMRLAGAFAGVGALALALWVGMSVSQSDLPGEETALAEATLEDSLNKATEEADVLRAKPTEGEAGTDLNSMGAGALTTPPPEAVDLYIADTAGYLQTLADYSGSILVLGVFDGTGHEAFEEAYAAYGADERFSFVGVRLDSDTRPENTTFPLMANRGSSLLETPVGGFTIVAPDGGIYGRGLLEASLVDTLRSSLEELGVR